MLKRPPADGERGVDARESEGSTRVRDDDWPATGLVSGAGSHSIDPSSAVAVPIARAAPWDPALAQLVVEVRDDPGAVGLLLHGSRALGTAGPDSNYDLTAIVHDADYALRRERGTVLERRFLAHSPAIEITYVNLGWLRRSARRGDPRARVFAPSVVLLDKSGEIEPMMRALVAGGHPDDDLVSAEYDRYLNGFVHSLKASSRDDDLGARAHAAASGQHLVRALFALEGKPTPYPDQLSVRLAELDAAQGWRAGFLRAALLRLLYAPDPPFQQMLERRVSVLMKSRGIWHEWRPDLEPLRNAKYDDL